MDQKEGKYVIHCIKHISKKKSYKNVTVVYLCGVGSPLPIQGVGLAISWPEDKALHVGHGVCHPIPERKEENLPTRIHS